MEAITTESNHSTVRRSAHCLWLVQQMDAHGTLDVAEPPPRLSWVGHLSPLSSFQDPSKLPLQETKQGTEAESGLFT